MNIPEIEDESEKLRRNTLIFSLFAIIFNFLGLSFPPLIFGFSLPPGSENKIWALIIIFSVYFFARYCYSNEAERHTIEISQKKSSLPDGYRQSCVNLIFWLHMKYHFRRHFLVGSISEAIQSATNAEARVSNLEMRLDSIQVAAYDTTRGQTHPNLLGFMFFYIRESNPCYARGAYITIVWPWWLSFWVWIRVHLNLLTNLKFIVNVYIPYALFVAGLGCTAYRYWGNSFPVFKQWLSNIV